MRSPNLYLLVHTHGSGDTTYTVELPDSVCLADCTYSEASAFGVDYTSCVVQCIISILGIDYEPEKRDVLSVTKVSDVVSISGHSLNKTMSAPELSGRVSS